MDTKLTHASRSELADSLRRRYQSTSSKTKKLILSEFIASTGYHPKYAVHRRLKCWRHEAVKRLICEMQDFTQDVGSGTG